MNFYERIALVCAQIPEGCVATYGQLAALCGKPRGARQAGYALGRGYGENAHRVVNAKGCLSGAEAFVLAGLQRRLLEAEGVIVQDDRVDLARYQWQPDEEEEDALCAAFLQRGI